MKASEPVKVTEYIFCAGGDTQDYSGRNPKDWVLYGSKDYDEASKSGRWTVIDTIYVTDNGGIADVKAGDETLTADADGKYTLKAGLGEVKVVVTDNEGNTAEVTVIVNYAGGNATYTTPATDEEESCQHPNIEYIEAKAPTETEEGNIEYRYCADCDKYFSDKDGENEITKADTVIEKLPADNAEYTTDDAEYREKDEIPPKTGDDESLALWFTMAAISVAGAIELKRKKRIWSK